MTDAHQPDPHRPGGAADEIYNLAAQSHVQVSFETAEYTANADALGTLRLLEAIRILGLEKATRFYQASTSELYGKVHEMPQSGDHAVLSALALRRGQALRLLDHRELPRSLRHARLERHPVQSREPDPRRDLRHAARSRARVAAIAQGLQDQLYLGNLDAKRDWGHARDYVEGMWLMLQQAAARRLRAGDRRDPLGARIRRGGVRAHRADASNGAARASRRRASTARPAPSLVSSRPALLPPDRGRLPARRSHEGAREARLEAPDRTFRGLVAEMVDADLQRGPAGVSHAMAPD